MAGGGTKSRRSAELLSSLKGTELARRFQPWFGASGRRFIASVFHVNESLPNAGLPDFDSCVVLVVSGGRARIVHDVLVIGGVQDRRRAAALAIAIGATEWHVHLSAVGESRAIAADLVASTAIAESRSA